MNKRALIPLIFSFVLTRPLLAQDGATEPAKGSATSSPTLTAPLFGEKLRINGIPNAGKLNEALYRGAQPRKPGFVELRKLGITTIVDLRGEDRERIAWERQEVEALGMRFVNIPVSGWAPPTNAQVAEFLALFRGDQQEKVFVHCRFGDDRTGVFVAAYRMAFEKWNDEHAMKEMYFFGFNGFWHPAMKTFVHEFPARLKYSPTLAAVPSQPPPS